MEKIKIRINNPNKKKIANTSVEISMTQTNNIIIQHTSIILLQTNNNKLTHHTSIKETERTSINNKEHKVILPNILMAKEIPNNNSRYSHHPSNKKRNRTINKKEIKLNSRPAPKKSSTTLYIGRTLPDNKLLISRLAPKKDRPKKLNCSDTQELWNRHTIRSSTYSTSFSFKT